MLEDELLIPTKTTKTKRKTISLVINGKIIKDMKEENLRKELKRRLERKEKQIKVTKPQIIARIGKKEK